MTGGIGSFLPGYAVGSSLEDAPDDGWPVAPSLVLAFGLSGALWALLIAGVRWLIA